MSYSRRQLETLGEPFGESATQKKLGGGYIAGGGGSSSAQPTSTSTTTSNIPDWAIPYATRNLGKAEALTDINQNPYQTFQGNRVADFSPLQQQAFTNVAGMQTNAGTGNAMNQTQDAYNRSANTGPYNATYFGNQYGSGQPFQNLGIGSLSTSAQNLNQYQMGPAQQVQNQGLNQYQMGPADQVNSQNFGQQSAQDYMSPYAQQAIDPTLRENQRQFEIASTGRQAAATRAGAFGGSRQAIEQSEAQRNLGRLQSDTQAVGMQAAYQNAQQQFNADQARRQQSMLANQQAGLTTGQANLGSALQTQGLGAGQNMQAQLANQQAGLTTGQANLGSALQTQGLGSGQNLQSQQLNQAAQLQAQGQGLQQNLAANQQAMQNAQLMAQYGLAGQQAGEQSRQFGANFGLQNNQQALAAAGQMGTLGQQQYAQQMGINAAQQQAGAQQQAQAQQGLSNSYQDFLNQQNYPYKQLGFMSDIMRGTPTSGGASSVYQAPSNTLGQIAGLGLAGYGAFKKEGGIISGYKRGGEVRNFAEGGLASLTDPATEIAAKSKLPPTNSAIALAKFMLPVIQKMHQPVAKEDSTTVAEDMAREILSLSPPQDMQQDMQQPPQETPDMSGIASLPVDNFQEENYRGGGIVAFQQGGASENTFDSGEMQKILNPAPKIDNTAAGKYGELLKTLEADRLRYAPESDEVIAAANKAARERAGITGLVGDTRMAQLTKDRSGEEERKDQAAKNFFISTGLNMAAKASERGNPVSGLASILQPLSVGADKALPGYLAEQEKLKSLTENRNKEMGDIENSRRAEAAGIVTLNQATLEKQLERVRKIDEKILGLQGKLAESASAKEVAIAGKIPTDMISYGQSYLRAARAKGDARPEAVIVSEGQLSHTREKAQYPVGVARVNQQEYAAAETVRVNEDKLFQDMQIEAGKQAEKTLASGMGQIALLNAISEDEKIAKENKRNKTNLPANNQEKLRQEATDSARGRLFREYLEKKRGAQTAPTSTTNTPPAGAPSYASITGAPVGGKIGAKTPKGWEILGPTGKVVGHAQD